MSSPRSRREYLRWSAATLGLALAGCSAPTTGSPPGQSQDDSEDRNQDESASTKIDDWQFDPKTVNKQGSGGGGGGGGNGGAGGGSARTVAQSKTVGLAAGGAKDVNNYRDNIEEGYLPIPTDLSYEGLFYDYYFDTGQKQACNTLFCPSYSTAITDDPFSGETEQYISVGLNSGLDASDFERKKLNLVVVLDISGSMTAEFNEYYYDRFGNKQQVEEDSRRPKIDIATESLADLTTHLRNDDRFGMVVFNNDAYVAKPVRSVEETDMEAIRGHIRELQAGGGTRLSGGVDSATELLSEYSDVDPTEYETRMIVLTDAMPNLGTTSENGLLGKLESNAEAGLYTTFIGIGVDFNTEIIDAITAVEGANYYSVHSAKQFKERLDDEFKYMVTPLVFDLSLELDAEGYDIEKVYGSTAAEEATGEILHVNTLFPSPKQKERTRGGIILVKLRKQSESTTLTLSASWETRTGKQQQSQATVQFPNRDPEYFANPGIHKAVLLTRYADLMKNWMTYERTNESGETSSSGESPEIDVPPEESELGQWERQSTDLTVSDYYRERFATFADYFEEEMGALGDSTLEQELEIVRSLATTDEAAEKVLTPPNSM